MEYRFVYCDSELKNVRKILDISIDLNERINCCSRLNSYFSEEGAIIPSVASMLSTMQRYLGKGNGIQANGYTWYFEALNSQLLNLTVQRDAQLNVDKSPADLKELNNMMNKTLSSKMLGKISDKLEESQTKRYSIMPSVSYKRDVSGRSILMRATSAVIYAVGRMISDALPQLEIPFNQDGVNTLLAYIKDGEYHTRSFTFIDDLALNAEVRASVKYNELKCKIEKINFVKTPELSVLVLLRSDGYQYYAEIVKYDKTEPTKEQCENYVRNFEVTEGKYRIDGIVFNYSDAMTYVSTQCVAENMEIDVTVGVNSQSGWKIKYVHSYY